jgi:hypothetical protein
MEGEGRRAQDVRKEARVCEFVYIDNQGQALRMMPLGRCE